MNNLHRELAPISDEAWTEIEDETKRTLRRYLAGRRIVDVEGPAGSALSAVGTGHLAGIDPPADGVQARQREVLPLVELRVPFALNREQIDDVARGSQDSDWQPARDAARQIAFAEDQAIFAGYPAAGIGGIVPGASNPPVILPADIADYPMAFAQAANQLRSAGVDGPYTAVLSAEAYTAVSEASDHGYPVIRHLRNVLDGELVWAPAISGAVLVTARGGDFTLHLGQDLSIGYLSHTETDVTLYLQETFTFQLITQEAAVSLTASGRGPAA
ncbi:MAG: family 1 encapsulin nanocompartment shell protein [Streptosporangiaceae bacterium]